MEGAEVEQAQAEDAEAEPEQPEQVQPEEPEPLLDAQEQRALRVLQALVQLPNSHLRPVAAAEVGDEAAARQLAEACRMK